MTSNKLSLDELKDIFQDCNINFLIGAGLSAPYLSLLGDTEKLLVELSKSVEKGSLCKNKGKSIRAFLYKNFFDNVISKNINILNNHKQLDKCKIQSNQNPQKNSDNFNESNTQGNSKERAQYIKRDIRNTEHSDELEKSKVLEKLNYYGDFLKIINTLLLRRRSTILSRQANIFTTNFDIFLEKSLEMLNLEYNDGFSGCLNPEFSLSNFKKSILKKSLHYDNTYELPVFNLIKLHGSLTWKKGNEKGKIIFDKNLYLIRKIKNMCDIYKNHINDFIKIDDTTNFESLIYEFGEQQPDKFSEEFIDKYEKILIINPTKEKFRETVLNKNYYELLRIYSTELEKENTVLFVMGFSFSDEHIREVTLRVANSNPTLKIYIFAYNKKAGNDIEKELEKSRQSNRNIQIIFPENLKNEKKAEENSSGDIEIDKQKIKKSNINHEKSNALSYEMRNKQENKSISEFNFQIINKEIFEKLLEKIQ